MTDILWISWEWHRRSETLCRYLGIEPVVLIADLPRLRRYAALTCRTLDVIRRAEPRVLIIQNPSMLLGLIAALARAWFRYRLVVDAHNGAITPERPLLRRLHFLQRFVQRSADMTVVTNSGLARVVEENGGRPFVLPDRLPEAPVHAGVRPLDGRHMLFICTFGDDEPYDEFLEAAKSFPKDVTVFVTGKKSRIPIRYLESPIPRVVFTGYLSDEDYWQTLVDADVVVDLTTREDCLVCGAYEAVAAGRPLVLSDTAALREYFRKGTVYTLNDRASIVEAVKAAFERAGTLEVDMREFRASLSAEWETLGLRFQGSLLAPE